MTAQTEKPNWQGRTGLSAGCTLAGPELLAILMEGHEHPCDRCNADRAKCHGFPNRDQRPAPTTPAIKAMKSFQIYRRPQRVVRPIYEAREFAPPSLLAWLRRPLRWLWRRCSRQHFHEELLPIQPVTVDVETIREGIHELEHAIDCIWNRRCRHIVVGPEMFSELRGEISEASFEFPMQIQLADGLRDVRVFDMQVHVVPWFTGCLLLPEWEDLR